MLVQEVVIFVSGHAAALCTGVIKKNLERSIRTNEKITQTYFSVPVSKYVPLLGLSLDFLGPIGFVAATCKLSGRRRLWSIET
jgi:hypothetical protein